MLGCRERHVERMGRRSDKDVIHVQQYKLCRVHTTLTLYRFTCLEAGLPRQTTVVNLRLHLALAGARNRVKP